MDKESRILVTGGTGFIGSYILRMLIHLGYKRIYALRRKSSKMDLANEISDQIQWIESDLLDLDTLYEAITGKDAVIHSGAMIAFNKREEKTLMEVNVTGTANVVNACLDGGIKKLVHVSSIAVFSRTSDNQVITEETSWDYHARNSLYAISKYRAEMEVWRGAAEGLAVAIINPSLVIGSGFWDSGSVSIFKQIFDGLPFYPAGTNGFVDVRDVALAAVRLLNPEIKQERFIISGGNLSYREVTELMATSMGKRAPSMILNPLIREMTLAFNWVQSFFRKKTQVISRSTLRHAQSHFFFDASKSIEVLKMQYRDPAETIRETSRQLLTASTKGFCPMVLPIS